MAKGGDEVFDLMFKGKKAQLTINAVLALFVIVVLLGSLNNVFISFVTTAAGNLTAAGFSDAALITNLIPLFIWLGVVISIFVLTQQS